jgi:hypothetical protein
MKQLLVILFLLLMGGLAFSQQETRNFGIAEVFRSGDSIFIKKLVTRVITIHDGDITKMQTPPDTASLYLSSDGSVYQGTTVWKRVTTPTTPVYVSETIDNLSSQNSYFGTWLQGTGTGHFNNSLTFSQTLGNTVTVSFSGVRVEWFAEKEKTHAIAAVSIDGGPEVEYDLYSPTNQKQVKIFEKELPNGPHTFRLRNTGKKSPLNPATTNNLWVTYDYLRITRPQ